MVCHSLNWRAWAYFIASMALILANESYAQKCPHIGDPGNFIGSRGRMDDGRECRWRLRIDRATGCPTNATECIPISSAERGSRNPQQGPQSSDARRQKQAAEWQKL